MGLNRSAVLTELDIEHRLARGRRENGCNLGRRPHGRDRLSRKYKLADVYRNALHPGDQDMIPAPGIEDQELSVAAEGPGVNNPAVTRGCDLAPALVAKEMPFSTPPAPSEPPKSRILRPLTGKANRPLAEAKAMAGATAGSFSAPRLGLPPGAAGAPCRLAVAAALAALSGPAPFSCDQALQALDLPGQVDARAPSASTSFSIALCLRCRSSTSAASLTESSFSWSRSASLSRLVAMVLRKFTSSPRSAEVSPRVRARARPIRAAWRCAAIAARPGRTSSAGGVRRPARCSAASTSTISRRESSEAGPPVRGCRAGAAGLGLADAGLDAAHLGGDVDQLLVELGAVLTDRRDIGLQFLLQFGRLGCCAARLQFLLALLDGIGGNGRRLLRGGGGLRYRRRKRCREARGKQQQGKQDSRRQRPAATGGVE